VALGVTDDLLHFIGVALFSHADFTFSFRGTLFLSESSLDGLNSGSFLCEISRLIEIVLALLSFAFLESVEQMRPAPEHGRVF